MNLKQFARQKLREGVAFPVPMQMNVTPKWTEAIVYQDPPFQIELIILAADVEVPPHIHNRVESVDVLLSGGGVATVNGYTVTDGQPGKRLLTVPKGSLHQGNSGPQGAAYLSFQKWDGEMGFITTDWEDAR